MKTLEYIDVRSGNVLDTVSLADGTLAYDTGAAKEVFEAVRERTEQNDDELYEELRDYSNGYVQFKTVAK